MPEFPEPSEPYPNHLAYSHKHDLSLQPTARRNPNGTFSSLWACEHCPDIFVGPYVGPIPDGYCRCGWVQKKWPRRRCEDCKRPLTAPGTSRAVMAFAREFYTNNADLLSDYWRAEFARVFPPDARTRDS
jgi:hypothetical protein